MQFPLRPHLPLFMQKLLLLKQSPLLLITVVFYDTADGVEVSLVMIWLSVVLVTVSLGIMIAGWSYA